LSKCLRTSARAGCRGKVPAVLVWFLLVLCRWTVAVTDVDPCVREFLGDQMKPGVGGPVVIGGLGDSGTRGARNILHFLGVDIAPALPTQDNHDFLGYIGENFADEIMPYVQSVLRSRLSEELDASVDVSEMTLSMLYSKINEQNGHERNLFEPHGKCQDGESGIQTCDLLRGEPYSDFIGDVVSHEGIQHSPESWGTLCRGLKKYQRKLAWSAENAVQNTPARLRADVREELKLSTLRKSVAWGWKLGKSVMMAREWEAVWPGQVKMIHVIRDGRDVSFGHLRHTTLQICRYFFENTPSVPIQRSYKMDRVKMKKMGGEVMNCFGPHTAIRTWSEANLAFRESGQKLLGDRFMTLRIEDIALDPNPRPTIRKILTFLGTIHESMTEEDNRYVDDLVERAVVFLGNHSHSYGGNKFTPEQKENMLDKLGLSATREEAREGSNILSTNAAFDHFGYKRNDWGLTEEQWTAKKG